MKPVAGVSPHLPGTLFPFCNAAGGAGGGEAERPRQGLLGKQRRGSVQAQDT